MPGSHSPIKNMLAGIATQALAKDASHHRTPSPTQHRPYQFDQEASPPLTPSTTSSSEQHADAGNGSTGDGSDSEEGTGDDSSDEEEGDIKKKAGFAPSAQKATGQAGPSSHAYGADVAAALAHSPEQGRNANDAIHAVNQTRYDGDENDEVYDEVDNISDDALDGDDGEMYAGNLQYNDEIADIQFLHNEPSEPTLADYFRFNTPDLRTFDGPALGDVDPFSLDSHFPQDSSRAGPSAPPPTPTSASRNVRFEIPPRLTIPKRLSTISGLGRLAPASMQAGGHSEYDMSGYETDGETTDQEEAPTSATKNPRDLVHRFDFIDPPPGGRAPKRRFQLSKAQSRSRFPTAGFWQLDRTVAFVRVIGDALTADVDLPSPKKVMVRQPDKSSGISPAITGFMLPSDLHMMLPDPVTEQSLRSDFAFPVPQHDDPTISNDTATAMQHDIETLAKELKDVEECSGRPVFPPIDRHGTLDRVGYCDVVEANEDILDELIWDLPNSDQESEDLDIGLDIADFMNFDTDSDDPDGDDILRLGESQENNSAEFARVYGQAAQILGMDKVAGGPERQSNSDDNSSTVDEKAEMAMPGGAAHRSVRHPTSGLALTKPRTRSNSSPSNRKRKASDAASASRPTVKTPRR